MISETYERKDFRKLLYLLCASNFVYVSKTLGTVRADQ